MSAHFLKFSVDDRLEVLLKQLFELGGVLLVERILLGTFVQSLVDIAVVSTQARVQRVVANLPCISQANSFVADLTEQIAVRLTN